MSISTLDSAAVDVAVEGGALKVVLRDGRTISAPLAWFPRLAAASQASLNDWRFIGDGEGIHWNLLDEDLSVAALLRVR